MSQPANTGLNPAGGSPFADNGAIPNGSKVAFIQFGPANSLSTTITGLVPGLSYTVTFRSNSRSGYPQPAATWSVNGGTPASMPTASVGGSNAWHTVTGTFTATASTAPLVVTNTTTAGTDATLLVDAFTIAFTTDQRGFPIVGLPDIGAYEAGTFDNFSAWSWETAGSALVFGNDQENDGAVNGLEYATRRDPAVSDTPLSPLLGATGPGGRTFQFRYQKDARDLRYIVQRSSSLSGWTEIYRYDTRSGQITETGVTADENATTQLITLTDPATGPRLFWRLLVEPSP